MAEKDFPEVDKEVNSTTARELKTQIDAGENVFLLDTRAEADFAEWHITGENVEILNYPYFQLLDEIPADLLSEFPEDKKITVLCAKGGSSEIVAANVEAEGYEVTHLERGMKAWARLYEYVELDVSPDVTIAQYQRPSSGCLAYLVVSGDEAAVIDPLRTFAEKYVQDARILGADIAYAIDTHVHADHISGTRSIAEKTDATAVVPESAVTRGIDYDREYDAVEDGDTIAVGDADIGVIHTPGHTTEMTAYKIGDVLFTGDGLFTESVARPDLEDAESARAAANTLYDSLVERVLTQPDQTIIAPAHYSDSASVDANGAYITILGELRDTMNALSMDAESFVEYILADMPPRPANYEEIIATNLGNQSPTDEEAFELELGPNNCAASSDAMTN